MKPMKPAKGSKKTDTYSVTEVGTLLEAIDTKITQIAEGHTNLDQKLEKVEIALHGNSRRLDQLELGFDVINGKVTRLEDAVSKLSKDLKETRQNLESKIENLDTKIDKARVELGSKIDILSVVEVGH